MGYNLYFQPPDQQYIKVVPISPAPINRIIDAERLEVPKYTRLAFTIFTKDVEIVLDDNTVITFCKFKGNVKLVVKSRDVKTAFIGNHVEGELIVDNTSNGDILLYKNTIVKKLKLKGPVQLLQNIVMGRTQEEPKPQDKSKILEEAKKTLEELDKMIEDLKKELD